MTLKDRVRELAQQAEAQQRILERLKRLERELAEIQSQLQDLKSELFREIISAR